MKITLSATVLAVTVIANVSPATASTAEKTAAQPTASVKSSKAVTPNTRERKVNYILVGKGTQKRIVRGGIPASQSGACLPETPENCTSPQQPTQTIEIIASRLSDENPLIPSNDLVATGWSDGWTTICSGGDCLGIQIDEIAIAPEDRNIFQEGIVRVSDVAEVEQDACASLAASLLAANIAPDIARNVANQTSTANSDADQRRISALNLWVTTKEANDLKSDLISPWPVGWLTRSGYRINDGYTLEHTYADGGKESFQAIFGAGGWMLKTNENTLRPGTGTSNCPR